MFAGAVSSPGELKKFWKPLKKFKKIQINIVALKFFFQQMLGGWGDGPVFPGCPN